MGVILIRRGPTRCLRSYVDFEPNEPALLLRRSNTVPARGPHVRRSPNKTSPRALRTVRTPWSPLRSDSGSGRNTDTSTTGFDQFFATLQPQLAVEHPEWDQPTVAKEVGRAWCILQREERERARLRSAGLLADDAASDDASLARRRGETWTKVKTRFSAGTGLLERLAQRPSRSALEASFSNVVDTATEYLASTEANRIWLESQWRSIDSNGNGTATQSEALGWLQRKFPKLARNSAASKAAFRATCLHHQRKFQADVAEGRRAKQRAVAKLVAPSPTNAAARTPPATPNRTLRLESGGAAKRALRGNKFFSLHKSEFRSLLRNVAYYQKCFELFDGSDTSMDARLSFDEVHAFVQRLGVVLTEKEMRAAFAAMDTDGSGMVFFPEFCSWYAKRAHPLPLDSEDDPAPAFEYAAISRCYEARSDVVSCAVIALSDPHNLDGGNDGKQPLHAVLILMMHAPQPCARELREWGEARLDPELVPRTFESMGQLLTASADRVARDKATYGL